VYGLAVERAGRSDLTREVDAWRARGQIYRHRGHAVFFVDDSGDGTDTLVCVHGFPTSSFDWHRLWPHLRQRFARLLACDLIGLGWSDKPLDYPYSVLDQADLVEGLLRERGIGAHHLLAHDYGDAVAQELLARQDERASATLASVCLLNGGLFPETHRARPIQRLLASPLGPLLARLSNRRSFGRGLAAVFGARTQPRAVELDALWAIAAYQNGPAVFPALLGYMAERRRHRARWVGALAGTQVPLRVIDGAADPVSGAHMVARYRALVTSPDCIELPGIGHYPQLEDPGAVFAALETFWTRVRQAAGAR
jgi:pimeloyl-ACP methyl ester carboxylesterase